MGSLWFHHRREAGAQATMCGSGGLASLCEFTYLLAQRLPWQLYQIVSPGSHDLEALAQKSLNKKLFSVVIIGGGGSGKRS